jgi:hypothetical protein
MVSGLRPDCIKALLNEDRALLHAKLDNIDRQLAQIVSRTPGFGDLVDAVRPDARLSQQAIRVLREFLESGAGKALDSQIDNVRVLSHL